MAKQARVLIVEDDDLIRITLETLLVDENYEVRVARHGAEALDGGRPGRRVIGRT